MYRCVGYLKKTPLEILKTHSHKHAEAILSQQKPALMDEVTQAIRSINAVDCLTKTSGEKSKVNKWGGLIFSPTTLNKYFKRLLLEPMGWLAWDAERERYFEPTLYFTDDSTISGAARFRKMDGIKDRVGLEVQLGKYAFMGYDIFSKMIIFKNFDLIDYGVEIVVVQEMVDCMSTGVSAFEHIMIDFQHRGEADIDIPVLVLGIGPTSSEWEDVKAIQTEYRQDPLATRQKYPAIGTSDLKGEAPGPK